MIKNEILCSLPAPYFYPFIRWWWLSLLLLCIQNNPFSFHSGLLIQVSTPLSEISRQKSCFHKSYRERFLFGMCFSLNCYNATVLIGNYPLGNNTHTYPECFLGPITVAEDDGVWASHGADVFQSGSITDGDSRHCKVLNTCGGERLLSVLETSRSFQAGLFCHHRCK